MTATLRVMLDQLVAPTEPDLAEASRELARALVAGAPAGCEVEGIAPAGGQIDPRSEVAGLAGIRRTALARRELAGALQLGVGTGIGGGMIHSPSLFAPLVRHDRVHDNDQTVVTVWDLRPWEAADELPRATVAWHRAMLKRAVRYADAVVAPTHSIAARLVELAPPLGDRIRVIAGASPLDFTVPSDEVGRRRGLDLPEGFLLLSGGPVRSDGLDVGLAAIGASGIDLPVVVIDTQEGDEPVIADLASAAGIPERMVHVRGPLAAADRAAVFGAALALVAPSRRAAFPWRVVDALTLGVPVIAAGSAVHAEVILDGGVLVDAADAAAVVDGLADALGRALASTSAADRLAVLAGDRGRAFSWREAAERVWQLHAEL
jgi:glycosyltransferase involved in cell wall biosynthesis